MRKIIPPSNQVQLDLFSPDYSPSEPVMPADTIAAHKPAAAPSVPPEEMSDEYLLTEFPRASVAAVSALGAELIKRRPAGWQEAAIKLWCRFRGFGGERPMVEQEIILTMAVETADRRLLDAIMVEGQILPCFEPFLVRAAAANGAALPTEMVEAGLRNKQADVRCAALRLAVIGEYRKVWGNHATIAISDDGFSPGYHCSNLVRRVPSKALVRVCSMRCAPRFDQRIC
ncbi:hypothetical protein BD293_3786 [Roseinatronobacter monicus]|uniref:Uncharacterized protein n=1 Tax=Roseinatronobacter monicus TaxID=393481 RepID=A0A543K5P9_9RHOB|nr:hypothetical protein BD293_3786 [Roseinatronobacter monicus]